MNIIEKVKYVYKLSKFISIVKKRIDNSNGTYKHVYKIIIEYDSKIKCLKHLDEVKNFFESNVE